MKKSFPHERTKASLMAANHVWQHPHRHQQVNMMVMEHLTANVVCYLLDVLNMSIFIFNTLVLRKRVSSNLYYNNIYIIIMYISGEVLTCLRKNHLFANFYLKLQSIQCPFNKFVNLQLVLAFLLLQPLRKHWCIKVCLQIRAWINTSTYMQSCRPDYDGGLMRINAHFYCFYEVLLS